VRPHRLPFVLEIATLLLLPSAAWSENMGATRIPPQVEAARNAPAIQFFHCSNSLREILGLARRNRFIVMLRSKFQRPSIFSESYFADLSVTR